MEFFIFCVCFTNSMIDMTINKIMVFLSNILNITFIYNKVLNLIRYNKFNNKYFILNNKLLLIFSQILNIKFLDNLDAKFNIFFKLRRQVSNLDAKIFYFFKDVV